MKLWIILLFLGLSFVAKAQQVEHEGVKYDVKGKAIFKDGKDVTSSLSVEKQNEIFAIFETSKIADNDADITARRAKEQKKSQKDIKKAEKAQKNAERAQKSAEKELKKKQNAQDDFGKATKKLERYQEKYERMKRKGKLSPNDDAKMLKNIDGYRDDLEKANKKLNRS